MKTAAESAAPEESDRGKGHGHKKKYRAKTQQAEAGSQRRGSIWIFADAGKRTQEKTGQTPAHDRYYDTASDAAGNWRHWIWHHAGNQE